MSEAEATPTPPKITGESAEYLHHWVAKSVYLTMREAGFLHVMSQAVGNAAAVRLMQDCFDADTEHLVPAVKDNEPAP